MAISLGLHDAVELLKQAITESFRETHVTKVDPALEGVERVIVLHSKKPKTTREIFGECWHTYPIVYKRVVEKKLRSGVVGR